jgi:RNA polymerase sigma-70 factor (ECF subfamily)
MIGTEFRIDVVHGDFAEPLRRFLLRLTFGEHHLAEDLLQETLLRAWRSLDHLPDDRDDLRRWLFTVARRLVIDAARARHCRPPEVAGADFTRMPDERDAYEGVIAVHTIRRALPRLTEEHRAVLLELYYRGRSTAQAAAILGIAEGTVKSRAHYALKSLRAYVEEEKI